MAVSLPSVSEFCSFFFLHFCSLQFMHVPVLVDSFNVLMLRILRTKSKKQMVSCSLSVTVAGLKG